MRFYLLAFLFSFQALMGQEHKGPEPPADYKGPCVVTFPKVKIQANNADVVQQFLASYIANLKRPDAGIRLSYVKESPGGFHYTFYQTYRGVEVYQSEIKVNTDRQRTVRSVLDNSFNTEGWNVNVSDANANNVIALDANGRALLAEKNIVDHMERITRGGEMIYERDTRSYFAAPDSLVSGRIFNPDPLTTAGQLYTIPPGIFHDTGDTNTVWLNNQLQTVNFRVNFTGSNFTLENSYIKIADVDSPTVIPVTPIVPQFYYNRSQTGFEDVNAFYHLNVYRDYVHSLGYTLADDLVTVDPHAWGTTTGGYSDQSSFSPNGGNPELLYGMGKVDDAEDADVLIHEYAHFLSYRAAPGTNTGSQRNSLDEAFGDYLAASYSAAISGFNKEWVFNWDGPPWSNNNSGGRTVATTLTYNNLSGSMYKNAPIWSTALMNIHNEIGRSVTDKLVFETHYSYASGLLMSDAALLLIDADTILNNGQYYCPIYKHLLDRALVPFYANNPCGISSVNQKEELNFAFVPMGGGFRVLNTSGQSLQLNLFAVSGNLVTGFDSIEPAFDYNNHSLPAGVYLVQLSNGLAARTFKWCKTN